MSEANKTVELKLEIKGSPRYKFEYKGRLEDTLNLAINALKDMKKVILLEEE